MFYQILNQVTGPFDFTIHRCDDAVQDIETEAKNFIAVDIDSGHWQVLAEDKAHARLALLTFDGKRRWKVMPIVDLNAAPKFSAMMMKLKIERDTLSKEHGLKKVGLKIIVDDVLLYGFTSGKLLASFRTILDVF